MSLERAYEFAGVTHLIALYDVFILEEQALSATTGWDYTNSSLVVNEMVRELEKVNPEIFTEEECVWYRDILWFWNHHAMLYAIKQADREAARLYGTRALGYQAENHPNKFTRLLFHLVCDELPEATRWARSIEYAVDRQSALDLIEDYTQGRFFGPPK